MLRRELDKEGADPNDTFLLHTILSKQYKSERKRRKLLLATLTYSEVDVNLKDASGKTALHSAVEVSAFVHHYHKDLYLYMYYVTGMLCARVLLCIGQVLIMSLCTLDRLLTL